MSIAHAEFLDAVEELLGPNGEGWSEDGPGEARNNTYCLATAAAAALSIVPGTIATRVLVFGGFCSAGNQIVRQHWPERVKSTTAGPVAAFNDDERTDFTDVQHFLKFVREELCS